MNQDTWTCHICRELRPDNKISVYSHDMLMDGRIPFKMNVRYCNDRPDCVEKAKTYSFFADVSSYENKRKARRDGENL